VDKVLIALGTESLAAANRQQLYVSVSRVQEAVRLYTDDKAAVMDAVRTDAKRLSATELMEGKAPVHRSSKMQRLIHMRKIHRAYEGVKEADARMVAARAAASRLPLRGLFLGFCFATMPEGQRVAILRASLLEGAIARRKARVVDVEGEKTHSFPGCADFPAVGKDVIVGLFVLSLLALLKNHIRAD